MKKHLLSIVLLLFCVSCFAQKNYEYCELSIESPNPFDTKTFKAYVTTTNYKTMIITDNGTEINFKTTMGALNFMAKRRWKVAQAYPINNSGKTVNNHNTYRSFLLYRELKEKELPKTKVKETKKTE